MSKKIDPSVEIGRKSNKITLTEFAYRKKGLKYFHAVCECGKTLIISLANFGRQKSCGCISIKDRYVTKHPAYQTWKMIRHRCYNEKHEFYHIYGGRGVIMCDEWKNNFWAFAEWAEANGWRPGLEVDKDKIRTANGLLYSPETCTILTHKENSQLLRTENYKRKVKVSDREIIGKSNLKASELAIIYGCSPITIQKIRKKYKNNSRDEKTK